MGLWSKSVSSNKYTLINLAVLYMRNLLTFILVLGFSHFAGAQTPPKKNSETWVVTSAWVKEIPPKQQAAVVGMAAIALGKKVTEIIEKSRGGKDQIWALKINACGHWMLADVTTKNPDIEKHFRTTGDLFSRVISGKVRGAEFEREAAKSQADASTLFNAIDDVTVQATKSQYESRIATTERSLVVFAMGCASREGKV